MTRMPTTEFKDTELGPIPLEWDAVPLRQIVDRSETRDPRLTPHSTFRYLDVTSVSSETNRVVGWKELKGQEAPSRARKVIRSGDTVFATVRPYLRNIAQVPEELDDQICSTGFCVLHARPELVATDYLYYAVLSDSFVSRVVAQQRGSSYPAVSDEVVLAEPIPLPPLPEQRAIARVLRTVQEAREATERVIAALRDLKKSLMRHLFTYGPVPVGAQNLPPLRDTELGPIPEHWRVVRLGDLFQIQQGKALAPEHRQGKSPRPFLRTANVLWGRIDLTNVDEMDFSDEEALRLALKPGDLLVCEGGDIGRTAMWTEALPGYCYQNHLHRLRVKTDNAEPTFYMYWMQAALLILRLYLGQANKTTIPNLSRARLAGFPIPLPPLAEQQEIARVLQAVDSRIQAEEGYARALRDLFKALLHELMTGRRRVQFTTENTGSTERE